MRYVTLYLLTDTINKNKDMSTWNIYTITSKLHECEEYLDKLMYIKNEEHFKLWCNLHNKNIEDKLSWQEYFLNLEEQLNEFTIFKYKVNTNFVAQIFRMYDKCVPLNCSYETDVEHQYFLDTYKENHSNINECKK